MFTQRALQRLLRLGPCGLALCLGLITTPLIAQGVGERVLAKLQRADLLDPYFQHQVAEVAMPLLQARPGRWRGVQVNDRYRSGWVNIYLMDGDRVTEPGLLDAEGFANVGPGTLQSGAFSHPASDLILLNTAYWKRLVAATYLTQSGGPRQLAQAMASVQAAGLAATEQAWSEATLQQDNQATRFTGLLLRGALAFVLAHEMGHLDAGPVAAAGGSPGRLLGMDPRSRDEANACPELNRAETNARHDVERAADLFAARLIGQQCRIGDSGSAGYQGTVLGAQWLFTASMSERLFAMGRSSASPVIERALRQLLGDAAYAQVIAPGRQMGFGVKAAFPDSHPPDVQRMRAFELALRSTPCGAAGLDLTQIELFEMVRAAHCQRLAAGTGGRP